MRSFIRSSGILLHPTSLPGRFGIGDLGPEAYRFVDFLAAAGQHYWQVLPFGPTGFADSPYQAFSAFAGNPLLVSPEVLVSAGYLLESDLADAPNFPRDRVDYGPVILYKYSLLQKAFARFNLSAPLEARTEFLEFCLRQAEWLDDYAAFMAIKNANGGKPWHEWEPAVARRSAQVMKELSASLSDEIEHFKFYQWLFFRQWLDLKQYANNRNVLLIGDIPIFVSADSADVWAHPEQFMLDENLNPIAVAGVPPDYFSATGQMWGNPHYRWDRMDQEGYTWWIDRFQQAFKLVDVVRIDHFRGFHNYWEIPGGEPTAVNGCWKLGPGARLFHAVTAALGNVAIIAEDLGDFDLESRAALDTLQAEFGYPGMKILQFAFDGGVNDPFLPYNFTKDYVVYTGTHDNDTTVGWFTGSSTPTDRERALAYLNTDGSDIAWDLIRLGWSSVAAIAVTTVQDLLSLGQSARMNTPATTGAPNWCWRVPEGALTPEIAARLRGLTQIYGRLVSAA